MSLSSQLTTLQNQLVSYYLPPVYGLGMIGNAINVLVFSDKQLRANICSWYFICAFLSQLLLLNCACLARIVAVLSGYDVSVYVLGFCKFRAYLYILSLVLSRHFICLISIDRWLITSSNVGLRRLSSPRPARWIIRGSITFWSLFSIHALIGYEGHTTGCAPSYGSVYDFFYAIYSIFTAILPMVIMTTFSVLIIMNVQKRVIRQIHPIDVSASAAIARPIISERSRVRLKRDRALIRLALVQTASYMLLNITTSIYPLYSYLTRAQSSIDANQQAITSFVSTFGLILLYTYSAMTFFIYTVASSAFRQECRTTCKRYWVKLKRSFQNFHH